MSSAPSPTHPTAATQALPERKPRRYEKGLDSNGTGLVVVHSMDDFVKMAIVRAAVYVYMGEKAFAYDQQFDGNDFAATHLLASVRGELAGCIRIRFFGDFAKMERLAVRREFRNSRLAFELVRAAVGLCRAKAIASFTAMPAKSISASGCISVSGSAIMARPSNWQAGRSSGRSKISSPSTMPSGSATIRFEPFALRDRGTSPARSSAPAPWRAEPWTQKKSVG